MAFKTLIAAAGLALAAVGGAGAAQAQYHSDRHHDGRSYDRGHHRDGARWQRSGYHHARDHRGYHGDRGWHRWQGHHRRCWTEWRHHHRVRRCR